MPLIHFLFGANNAGAAPPASPPPILFLFWGESNSGGIAPNTSATTGELAVRSQVQIYNSSTSLFESLHIGVNNLIGHVGLESHLNDAHGWELELTNRKEAGTLTIRSTVYLLKAGQGGTKIAQWQPGGTYTGGTTIDPYVTLKNRLTTAKSLIFNATGQQPIIYAFYSQGINDAIAATSTVTWKTQTIDLFIKFRTDFGGSIPIFMTKINQTGNATYDPAPYNTKMDEIVAGDIYTFTAPHNSATILSDGNHWDYAGMKTIAASLITVLKANYSL